MNSRLWLFAAILAVLGCRESPEVPVDRVLLRVTGSWTPATADASETRRVAPATILIFRSNREFVEFHGTLIEQPDDTLYISADHNYTVAAGRWSEDGAAIEARRERVFRRSRPEGLEPLCAATDLSFRISGNSVLGQAGDGSDGTYSPITRLVAPDFESYVDRAKQNGVSCAKSTG